MMRAGKLDREVQFTRYSLVDDGFGTTESFSNYGSLVWASKKDISDAERLRAGTVEATATTRFQVRWSDFTMGITPKDQLVCEGNTYSIVGIKEADGRHEGIEITAARITA